MGRKIVAVASALVVVIIVAGIVGYVGMVMGYEMGYLTAVSDRYVHTFRTSDPHALTVPQRRSLVSDMNATYRMHVSMVGDNVRVDSRQVTQQAMDEVSKLLATYAGSSSSRTLVHR